MARGSAAGEIIRPRPLDDEVRMVFMPRISAAC